MAGRRRSRGREGKARANLFDAGVNALAFGVFALLVPSLIPGPMGHAFALGMRPAGWVAIAAGLVLLGIHKLMSAEATQAERPRLDPRHATLPPERLDPTLEPSLVDTSAARAYVDAVRRTEADEEPPAVPTRWDADVFKVIEWRRFEALCEWLFSQAGFETKTQSHGADGGIDIWLYSKHQPGSPVSVVQCKCWSSKAVSVVEVRALLGSMTDKKVQRGIFATTSTFTADAQRLAKGNGIHLLDRKGLLDLIMSRTEEQRAELLAVATKGQFWVPTCPSCGVKMVRRSPKAGGRRFWGCATFPACMTTLNT